MSAPVTDETLHEWLAERRANADPPERDVLDALDRCVENSSRGWYDDEWGDDEPGEPIPRAAGQWGGAQPSDEAIIEERWDTEDAVAPLKAIDGVTDVEVLIERGPELTLTEVRWRHRGALHGLKGAFGQGATVARQALLCAQRLPVRDAVAGR